MKNITTRIYREPAFDNPSCCNAWRNVLITPFPRNSILLVLDLRSGEYLVSVCKTDPQGIAIDLNIEGTHWMELADICRPNSRKCRIDVKDNRHLSQYQQDQLRLQNKLQYKHASWMIRHKVFELFSPKIIKFIGACGLFIIVCKLITGMGYYSMYTGIINNTGKQISNILEVYKKNGSKD